MYIKQAVCAVRQIDEKLTSEKLQSCQEKQIKPKKNQIFLSLLKDLEQIVTH